MIMRKQTTSFVTKTKLTRCVLIELNRHIDYTSENFGIRFSQYIYISDRIFYFLQSFEIFMVI